MPDVAIICEFNPFHNGHAAILEHARHLAGPEGGVVCIMSGNFVQRGDLAIVPKWERAKMALSCGADMVVEIPSVFAIQSAEYFAAAGVSVVADLGFIDFLLFGSETGDVEELEKIALRSVSDVSLSESASYARALESSNGKKLSPNDILGVEYVRALKKSGSSIKPIAIKRVGNSCETDESASSGSALSIRNLLKEGNIPSVSSFMPSAAFDILQKSLERNGLPDVSRLESYVVGKILELGASGIRDLPGISEGLENKIYKEVASGASLSEIIENCTGKRYTRSRIRRILLSVLTGATQNLVSNPQNVPYVRILGIRDGKKSLLTTVSTSSSVPVIVGNFPANYELSDTFTNDVKKMIRGEILATDLYSLSFESSASRKAGKELSTGLTVNG